MRGRKPIRNQRGGWLLLGEKGEPKTLKVAEALEEALCFGRINGHMQSIDAVSCLKRFACRTPKSVWSDKSRALAEKLKAQGLMTDRKPL